MTGRKRQVGQHAADTRNADKRKNINYNRGTRIIAAHTHTNARTNDGLNRSKVCENDRQNTEDNKPDKRLENIVGDKNQLPNNQTD